MPRDRVEFDWNVPVTVALEYAEGKLTPSKNGWADQYQWTLTENRICWVDAEAEDKRKALGIGKGEQFVVCKRRIGTVKKWEVERIAEETTLAGSLRASLALIERRAENSERPGVTAPAVPMQSTHLGQAQATTGGTRSGKVMAGAMVAAIDALETAREYAAAKGIEPDWDIVARVSATLFIQYSKLNQERAS